MDFDATVGSSMIARLRRSGLIAAISCLVIVGCGSDDDGAVTVGPDAPRSVGWAIAESLTLPGTIGGVFAAAAGTSAHVSLTGGVAVVEIETREPQSTFLFPFSGASISGLNAQGDLMAVDSFREAAVLDAFTGEEFLIAPGGSSGGSTIANDTLYTTYFNARGLGINSIDGTVSDFLNPWDMTDRDAGPRIVARSPSEATVVFDDDFQQVLHVLETETNSLIGRHLIGSSPLEIFLPDDETAVLVFPAVIQRTSGQATAPGTVAFVDLTGTNSVPRVVSDEALSDPVTAAINLRDQLLYVLVQVVVEENSVEVPIGFPPQIDRLLGLDLVVFDLQSREVRSRSAIAELEFDDVLPSTSLEYAERSGVVLLGLGNQLHFLAQL